MKPWIGCDIRLLRKQLGWSRTQLAKHLGCSPLKIVKMEEDEVFPISAEKARLETLWMEVEEHLDGFHRQARIDAYINEAGLDQVRADEMSDEKVDIKVDMKEPID